MRTAHIVEMGKVGLAVGSSSTVVMQYGRFVVLPHFTGVTGLTL
jgi:hypothetical protein